MARVTSYVYFPVRKLGVNLVHHRDHVARDLFFWIAIRGEIALRVAEGALLTERCTKSAHHFT